MKFIVPTLILAFITLFILWLMWSGWRRRSQRDGALVVATPALTGSLIASFDRVFYVATTPADTPLERIAVPGLAFRGWTQVEVRTDGVGITVTGERTVPISAEVVTGVRETQLTIDKVVERDGLSSLAWQSERGLLTSQFRFGSPEAQQHFAASVDEMLRTHPHAANTHLTKETP